MVWAANGIEETAKLCAAAGRPRISTIRRGVGPEPGLQIAVVRASDLVSHREGLLDDLQLVVHPGFQLEDHATVAEGFGFENYVMLTTISDRVARVQFLDRHRLRNSIWLHL